MKKVDLKELFDRQIDIQKMAFNKRLPEHSPELISYFALGLMAEVGEVLQVDKSWKPFNAKEYNSLISDDALIKELADCYLFLMNLTLACGFGAALITNAIKEKQQVVYKRIKAEKESKYGEDNCN